MYEFSTAPGRSVGGKGEEVTIAGEYAVTFGANQIDFSRVRAGISCGARPIPRSRRNWRNWRRRGRVLSGTPQGRRDPATVVVSGALGERLVIKIIDDAGRMGRGETTSALERSQRRALDEASLKKAIGELGGTPSPRRASTRLRFEVSRATATTLVRAMDYTSLRVRSKPRDETPWRRCAERERRVVPIAPRARHERRRRRAAATRGGETSPTASNAETTRARRRVMCRLASVRRCRCSVEPARRRKPPSASTAWRKSRLIFGGARITKSRARGARRR